MCSSVSAILAWGFAFFYVLNILFRGKSERVTVLADPHVWGLCKCRNFFLWFFGGIVFGIPMLSNMWMRLGERNCGD